MIEEGNMKKFIINKYYNLLMLLEDFFGFFETKINNHRKNIDHKYWDKYLK
jgi:hypothetical protein